MMLWKTEYKPLFWIVAMFVAVYYLPVGNPRFEQGILEGLQLVKWYAREHVLLCLVPAFFIAGGISVFVSQASVMRYLGPGANPVLAYGVASVSGTILAVCSCTVLPLFAGIYKMGAGLGPASAFLYSGPAISVLAIVLTARILGLEMGLARAVGAIGFSIVIGLLMHLIYRREETQKATAAAGQPAVPVKHTLWQNGLFFAAMVGILVFANWSKPDESAGFWHAIWMQKWPLTSGFAALLAVTLVGWFGLAWWKVLPVAVLTATLAVVLPQVPMVAFLAGSVGLAMITSTSKGEPGEWFRASWDLAKQILPLLLIGVLISGALLGRPGQEGWIPSAWVADAVGGNSLVANLLASVVGAFMYFATLTEVPILQGLMGSGMGKGPALALLLAGPALSLPSMIVLRSIMGLQKTVVYCGLVVIMATMAGMIYGTFG